MQRNLERIDDRGIVRHRVHARADAVRDARLALPVPADDECQSEVGVERGEGDGERDDGRVEQRLRGAVSVDGGLLDCHVLDHTDAERRRAVLALEPDSPYAAPHGGAVWALELELMLAVWAVVIAVDDDAHDLLPARRGEEFEHRVPDDVALGPAEERRRSGVRAEDQIVGVRDGENRGEALERVDEPRELGFVGVEARMPADGHLVT